MVLFYCAKIYQLDISLETVLSRHLYKELLRRNIILSELERSVLYG